MEQSITYWFLIITTLILITGELNTIWTNNLQKSSAPEVPPHPKNYIPPNTSITSTTNSINSADNKEQINEVKKEEFAVITPATFASNWEGIKHRNMLMKVLL